MGSSRPRRHFTPSRGWINDPVALAWHEGAYHLFYQALPDDTAWSPGCHWGHATSLDLVTWQVHGSVLSPDSDEDGCWSGDLVQHDAGATIFYTAVHLGALGRGSIRTAWPTDASWDSWSKSDVVIAGPPDGIPGLESFRDPCVVRDGDMWRMVVGAGFEDGTAAALTYVSHDLRAWAFQGILAQRHTSDDQPESTGSVWECPQLLLVDGAWFLVVSVMKGQVLSHVAYAAGDLVDGAFVARTWRRLTHGDLYYAATSFVDAEGRRGLLFWLRGVESLSDGWAGAISLPYLVERDGDALRLSLHPLARDPEDTGQEVLDGPVLEVITSVGLLAVTVPGV
jgi:beta-fructofuranosidase